jgi:hypothetical protein
MPGGKKSGEDVPGHGIAIERRRFYRVRIAKSMTQEEREEAGNWLVSSLCECGRRSKWLPDTKRGVHLVTLSGLGHAWTKGAAAARAQRAAERAAARAEIERLTAEEQGLTARWDVERSRHGIAWAVGRCLACSRIGVCICPLDCARCSGCRCTCECYVCGLEDERRRV